MRKWITEVVTIEEVESWKQNDIITIKAGTGAGKSYFIKNNLYAIAKRDKKRILMLIHRKNCTDQFQKEIEKAGKHKDGVIDIRTYQSIEAVERSGVIFELGYYDYIVCDEWHYFMSDSAFNRFCDMSLKAILGTKAIKIFMSATGDDMKRFLTNDNMLGLPTIDYELPIDFKFIKKLQFYYKNETLEEYVKQAIERNEKAVFFIRSATKAYGLYEKYREHSIFNCSTSNKEHYQYVDEQQIDDILKNEGFDKVDEAGNKDSTDGKLILFTTTCMDAGVNLVMDDLKHIVCDEIPDTGTLIQCIGRKRLQHKDDYINLYIKAIHNQMLGGKETQARNRIELADYFRKHGEKKLVQEHYRELNDNMIYDEPTETGSKKKLNLLMYLRVLSDIREIEIIKTFSGQHSYCRYITEHVFKLGHFSLYEAEKEADDLETYLDGVIGRKLFKDDQKELIDRIDLRVNGRQQKSYKKLNEGLDMIKVNYVIIRNVDNRRKLDDGSENPNRDKTYWEVVRSLA